MSVEKSKGKNLLDGLQKYVKSSQDSDEKKPGLPASLNAPGRTISVQDNQSIYSAHSLMIPEGKKRQKGGSITSRTSLRSNTSQRSFSQKIGGYKKRISKFLGFEVESDTTMLSLGTIDESDDFELMHDLENMDYYHDTRTITPWQDFKIKMAYVIMFIEWLAFVRFWMWLMDCLNKGFDKWFGDFFKDLEESKIFND